MDTKIKYNNAHHRKYYCPSCLMSVRATKEVRIICEDCGQRLQLFIKPDRQDRDGEIPKERRI